MKRLPGASGERMSPNFHRVLSWSAMTRPRVLPFAAAVTRGLTEGGADVIDIGLCGTEEVYFQTFHRADQVACRWRHHGYRPAQIDGL